MEVIADVTGYDGHTISGIDPTWKLYLITVDMTYLQKEQSSSWCNFLYTY